jgi:hypothetical protein
LSPLAGGSSPTLSGSSSSPGIGSAVQGAAQSALSGITGGITGAAGKFFGTLFGIDAQAITILVGLILIAGGIFLFKPVQNVAVKVAKNASKAAEVAA